MKRISYFALFLLSTNALFGQEKLDTTVLNTVVIQGNRIQTPFNQATRSIQILSKEEIQRLPVKSVNELLAYVNGVDLRQRGPFGTQADVSIDGGSFEQTLVLLNGVKLIDAQTAHNMLNIPVPLEAIERIEVLRGPAARVYGINSLTGAINIVTKSEEHSFVGVHTYAGSSFQSKQDSTERKGIYGGGGVQVTANFGTKKQSHLLAMSKDTYNGQRYNTAQDNNRLFYNGSYRFNDNHSIQWLGGYTYNNFGANGFYAAPGDKESKEIVETVLTSIGSTHKFGRFTLRPRISNRYNEDDYRYFRYNPKVARSMHYTNALMAELNASVETKIGEFGLGWESRFETINSSNIGRHDRSNHGISAEYKGFYWNKLIATAGAYVNYNTSFGWQVYPGVDLAYLFLPGWKLSFSAGSGQRIPSFTDLYLQQKGNVGNANLKPENAWQYEGALQYNWKTLRVSASYFYRDISQFIDWVRDTVTQPYSPINLGRNQVHGLSANVQQQLHLKNEHTFGYFVKYTYLAPSYKAATNQQSKYVLESLKNQLMLGVNYGYKGFSIQVTSRLIERFKLASYFLLDARVSYAINPVVIYVEGTNLLGSQYKEAGAVPMPTRWFSLGVRYNWSKK